MAMGNGMNNGGGQPANGLEQELALLKEQHKWLHDKKIRTEQELASTTTQLAALEEEAKAQYGTSDPQELAKLLEEKKAENARLVNEYREHIMSIKEGLDNLEGNN
jgi:flagellar motility protein MotE (MotC chaperone)